MGHGHRYMYYMTGLPGWMRFGFSPGWGGLPPAAQYLQQTGQLPQFTSYLQQQMPMMPAMPTSMPQQVPTMQQMSTPQMTKEQELSMLEQQANMLEQQIEVIRKRMEELKE